MTEHLSATMGAHNQVDRAVRQHSRPRPDTPEVPDMRHRTHNPPVSRNRYPVPWRNDPRPTPAWSDANLSFGMPASYEDMIALGLDPYTGEVAA